MLNKRTAPRASATVRREKALGLYVPDDPGTLQLTDTDELFLRLQDNSDFNLFLTWLNETFRGRLKNEDLSDAALRHRCGKEAVPIEVEARLKEAREKLERHRRLRADYERARRNAG